MNLDLTVEQNAAAPCQTCGGSGHVWTTIEGFPAHHVKAPCPRCRDGKPVIEIRVDVS